PLVDGLPRVNCCESLMTIMLSSLNKIAPDFSEAIYSLIDYQIRISFHYLQFEIAYRQNYLIYFNYLIFQQALYAYRCTIHRVPTLGG
ncbi:hypothetical protein AB7Z50_18050, partial [Providencia rettgeri]